MTPEQIAGLGTALSQFLRAFNPCFFECRLLDRFDIYCRGLVSDLQRKTVEPIALAAGSTVGTLQLFLTQRAWDHGRLRDLLQQRVARQHAPPPGQPHSADDPGVIGLIDETSAVKKGTETPGVQRQYCGTVGKLENGIVSVYLGYCHRDFKMLLDSELLLPQSWSEDRDRCAAADIPDTLVYPTDRTYWLIVAWNRVTDEYKYFLSNAPPATAVDLLLRVAFRRAKIEHLFRIAKGEVGFTHFEGRSYVGLMRHMILCQTVLLFLAEQAKRLAPPEELEPPKTAGVQRAKTPFEKRGEKAASHDGATGRGAQSHLRALA